MTLLTKPKTKWDTLPTPPVKRLFAEFKTYEEMEEFRKRNAIEDYLGIFSYGLPYPFTILWDSEKERSDFT